MLGELRRERVSGEENEERVKIESLGISVIAGPPLGLSFESRKNETSRRMQNPEATMTNESKRERNQGGTGTRPLSCRARVRIFRPFGKAERLQYSEGELPGSN